jgi:hypothetical protein
MAKAAVKGPEPFDKLRTAPAEGHVPVASGRTGNAASRLRCVRLALADRRVGQWGQAICIRNQQLASELDAKIGRAPTFPGWSVGRARLTLNQD